MIWIGGSVSFRRRFRHVGHGILEGFLSVFLIGVSYTMLVSFSPSYPPISLSKYFDTPFFFPHTHLCITFSKVESRNLFAIGGA